MTTGGGIQSDLQCSCSGNISRLFGSHETYTIEPLDSRGSETIRLFGHVAQLVFIQIKETVRENVKHNWSGIQTTSVRDNCDRSCREELSSSKVKRVGCVQLGTGRWSLGNGSSSSGFQAKPNPCKLDMVLDTFVGQRKPSPQLKRLFNSSNNMICLKFGRVIKADLFDKLNLSGVKCLMTWNFLCWQFLKLKVKG